MVSGGAITLGIDSAKLPNIPTSEGFSTIPYLSVILLNYNTGKAINFCKFCGNNPGTKLSALSVGNFERADDQLLKPVIKDHR